MPTAKLVPLASLKSWPGNPRRIRPERLEQLKRSMTSDPAMMDARPLVALPDGTVIMGNQRLAAAKDAQTTVFEIPRPSRSEEHPTMKPVELVAACLRNSSRRGDLILDPFAGSGTTLIAADMLGRRAALMEIDPAYCDVIRERYARLVEGAS